MSNPLYGDPIGYNSMSIPGNVQDMYSLPQYEQAYGSMSVPQPQPEPVDPYDPMGMNETFINMAMADQFAHFPNPLMETIDMENRANMDLVTLMHLDPF